jgi:ABC-type glycerol-3-phosphate transport system permease component
MTRTTHEPLVATQQEIATLSPFQGVFSLWRRVAKIIPYVIVVVICLVMVFPVLWTVSSSFKAQTEVLKYPPTWLPENPTLDGYDRVLSARGRMPRYVLNTLILATLSTAASALIASLAGYSFSRFRFRGRQAILVLILATIMIPGLTQLIPLYAMLASWGLLNTYLGLVLIYSSGQLPFSIWIMKSFFDTIPSELEEAGMIDGCSVWQALFRIILPISAPGLMAVTVLNFVGTWNEFLTNLVMTSTDTMRNVSVGLWNFLSWYGVDYGAVNAAAVVVMVPVIVIFIFGRGYFIRGMLEGSLKG